MDRDETEIRALIERWAKAVHQGDMEAVLADHMQDIVMFDMPPPNEVRGMDAYHDTWSPFSNISATALRSRSPRSTSPRERMSPSSHALLKCGKPEGLAKDPDTRLRLTPRASQGGQPPGGSA